MCGKKFVKKKKICGKKFFKKFVIDFAYVQRGGNVDV